MIKYGVVDVHRMVDDLCSWRHLYIAGRMHKPVVTVKEDARVSEAQQGNVRSAAAAALLLLPQAFSTEVGMWERHRCVLEEVGGW